MESPVSVEHQVTTAPRSRTLPRRVWTILGLTVAAVLILYAIAWGIYWPFTKQEVIDTLQQRSLRTVTVGSFHRTYFPPGCVAEDIKFLRIQRKDKPPLITIRRLTVSTSYARLFTLERKLEVVRVVGLHVMVPAREPEGQPSPVLPLTYSDSKNSMPIVTLYADGAMLDFYRDSNPKPLRITVHKLEMHNISTNTALTYKVLLDNSEPPGAITSEGSFGPWNPKDPGGAPVHGSFRYDNVNLGFFQEFGGTLSSTGTFDGKLARINVSGRAEVADFTLTGSSHKRRLASDYKVGVNATNGDVELTSVSGKFERTNLLVKGLIAGVKGETGKDMSLEVSSNQARLEDLIDLFIAGKQAPLTGNATFHLKADIPAKRTSFLGGMAASGEFGIAGGKFNDKDTEEGLTRLSESTLETQRDEKENPPMVLSNLKGEVTARDGIAHLSHVEFVIPGAHAWVGGTFSLQTYQTDMDGTLITEGDVSATQTGFKSFLLKAMTPLLKHKNHAKLVPFKIAGPYGHVNISLDLDQKQQAGGSNHR